MKVHRISRKTKVANHDLDIRIVYNNDAISTDIQKTKLFSPLKSGNPERGR